VASPAQPPMVVETPYVPTDEENEYLELCGQAIAKGCDAAKTATAAGNSEEYLRFAQGVKQLTDAYLEIKTGGKPRGNSQPR
jgi:hypothetical protein